MFYERENAFSKASVGVALPRVLLLEDGPYALANCRKILGEMDFDLVSCHDLGQAMDLFASRHFDLIFIHASALPSKGLQFCHWVKSQSVVPIIALTNRAGAVTEEMCIDAGADDYVVCPVSKKILTSRIAQQMERTRNAERRQAQFLSYENLYLDLVSHALLIDHEMVSLTASELRMLTEFMRHPERVISRGQILDAIGIGDGPGSDHIVDSHMSRLRIKIAKAGGPKVLGAVRGLGFRFASTVQVNQSRSASNSRNMRLVSP